MNAALNRLLGPSPLGDVLIDDSPPRAHAVDPPSRIAERRDEESNAFFERYFDPLFDALVVGFGRLLDQCVHAKRAGRRLSDSPQTFAIVVSIDIGHRHWLDDSDRSSI